MALGSVTVRVTEFEPTLAQVNEVAEAEVLATEQLSEEPLSISPAVMLAFPLPSRKTVTSRHTAAGAVVSCTVTVAVQVAVPPSTSVTVRVDVLAPRFAQVKEVGVALRLPIPQLSEDPLSISLAVMDALPLPSRKTVTS